MIRAFLIGEPVAFASGYRGPESIKYLHLDVHSSCTCNVLPRAYNELDTYVGEIHRALDFVEGSARKFITAITSRSGRPQKSRLTVRSQISGHSFASLISGRRVARCIRVSWRVLARVPKKEAAGRASEIERFRVLSARS